MLPVDRDVVEQRAEARAGLITAPFVSFRIHSRDCSTSRTTIGGVWNVSKNDQSQARKPALATGMWQLLPRSAAQLLVHRGPHGARPDGGYTFTDDNGAG